MAGGRPLPGRQRKTVAGPHRGQQSQRPPAQRLGPQDEYPRRRGAALAGAPQDQCPEARALADLGQEALQQKILALREPYKTPCRLCLLEGYTPAEAARLCRRPEKTLNAQLWRAKKMLRAQIEQEREQERRTEDGTV